jgi:hypothetical protein
MPDSIGKVFLDLETNAAPFQQQLNGIAGKSTNMVKSAFMGLGKVMAGAFAVTKLVQFGKASIDLASDLQEVQNVVDVVFGESSNQINNFAKNAITQYGLSELSAKQYASTMGAMLKSMGFLTCAMALSDDSVGIDDEIIEKSEKIAIILGTEGTGLAKETIAACERTVRIPMSHGVDSLNVAAASAVAFWQLTR